MTSSTGSSGWSRNGMFSYNDTKSSGSARKRERGDEQRQNDRDRMTRDRMTRDRMTETSAGKKCGPWSAGYLALAYTCAGKPLLAARRSILDCADLMRPLMSSSRFRSVDTRLVILLN